MERSDTFYEQHVGTLSFRIHPTYFDQATELLQATAGRARELSITVLQVYLAACDGKQKDLLTAAGFGLETRLCGRLCHAGEKMDLLVYTLSLAGEIPRFSRGDYYGNRKTWQQERLDGQGKKHCRSTSLRQFGKGRNEILSRTLTTPTRRRAATSAVAHRELQDSCLKIS